MTFDEDIQFFTAIKMKPFLNCVQNDLILHPLTI